MEDFLEGLFPFNLEKLDDIESLANKVTKSLTEASSLCEKALSVAGENLKQQTVKAQANAESEYKALLDGINSEFSLIKYELGIHGLNWDSPDWQDYQRANNFQLPLFTRFGDLYSTNIPFISDDEIHNGKLSLITTPALFSIIGGKNVLIKAKGVGKEKARAVIQSIVLRLLATVPPNKLHLLCIDPVQLGTTVAGFIKGLPEITGNMAWFNPNDIDSKLTELESHIAYVKQKYLGISYASIEEYNKNAGQIEEPYKLLVISDFPIRFTESSAQRLISIATTGISAGVYVIVMIDEDQPKPRGFVLADLERNTTILCCENDNNYLDADVFKQISLILDEPPAAKHFESLITSIKTEIESAKSTGVKIPFAIPQQENWWKNDSRVEISATIGQFGAREQLIFSFDERLFNSALVIGVPGSGKSTLLHTVISGLAFTYSPDELELYLLDCKQVEFKEYAKFKLPHAQVVAVHSGRDFGLSVLRRLNQELESRKAIFKTSDITHLKKYRDIKGNKMPRVLLIIDEFQELFSNDDAIARTSEQLLDRLIRQGRAFGIHVLLASQSLSGRNAISQAIIDQIAVRVALRLRSESESRRVLSDGNDAASHLSRPGEAIYNDQNGLKEHNRRFQVYWFDEDKRQTFLKELRLLADKSGFSERIPTVFDGDAAAFIQDNRELTKAISEKSWFPLQRGYAVKTWLGAPTEIKEHTTAVFKRQSSSNLLVIGEREHEERTIGILMSSLLSIAAQQSAQFAKFFIFNVTDVGDTWHDLPQILKDNLPHKVTLITRDMAKLVIQDISSELDARRQKESNDPAIYIAILGLHYINSFRVQKSEKSFDYKEKIKDAPSNEILLNILKYGSEKGIHTLLWYNRYTDLRQFFDADIRDLCDMKVAFQASESDSRAIIDSDAATKLGNNRAILYDKPKSSVEKFIPYEPPTPEWLEQQCQIISSKRG